MNRLALILAASALATTAAFGAEPVKPAQPNAMIASLTIELDDARPIAAAVLELETRHGIAISYEDPAFVNAADIADVTEAVRRDLASFAQGAAPKVLVPKAGAIRFDYDGDRSTGRPVDLTATLAAMFASHDAAGNPGAFTAFESGGMTHVVPAFVKNQAGAAEPVTPVLDAVGGMPAMQSNGIDALMALCEAISHASGQLVVVGTIPNNLFGNASVALPGGEARSRDVLIALLNQLPAKCSWQLLYDPGMKFYALNVHVIE